jgi:hypothetical protein
VSDRLLPTRTGAWMTRDAPTHLGGGSRFVSAVDSLAEEADSSKKQRISRNRGSHIRHAGGSLAGAHPLRYSSGAFPLQEGFRESAIEGGECSVMADDQAVHLQGRERSERCREGLVRETREAHCWWRDRTPAERNDE